MNNYAHAGARVPVNLLDFSSISLGWRAQKIYNVEIRTKILQ